MSPPVVIYVGVSLAVVGVAYAIHETWEPHIKPELKKVQHAAKSWINKKRSQHAAQVEAQQQQPMRQATSEVHETSQQTDGRTSPFYRAIYSALQLPREREGNNLRQRTNRSAPGVSTPNETVELTEIDKSVPHLSHPTLTPGQFSVGSSSAPSVAGDPFVDPPSNPQPPTGLISPPLSHYSTILSTTDLTQPHAALEAHTPTQEEHSSGLQLNIHVLRDPPNARIPRVASTASATHSWQNVNVNLHLHPLSNVDSPWSPTSELSSSAWTEGGIGEGRGTPSRTGDLAFMPSGIHHHDVGEDDNFSIGSYDDMASHTSGHVSQGQNSHHSQDEEEPPSPTHYSAPMSPVEGRQSGGSSAGWESVRSPSMSPPPEGSRRRLV